jgi:cell wall assembly regulator SMI1
MPKAKLMPPAKETDIRAAESSLGIELPSDLKQLLRESDGVDAFYNHPVCSISQIVEMNHEYRTADYLADRMPFDHLLFFGEAGSGDDFAFPIYRNREIGSNVFVWEHETDCRQNYAGSLSDFLIHYAVEFYQPRANEISKSG